MDDVEGAPGEKVLDACSETRISYRNVRAFAVGVNPRESLGRCSEPVYRDRTIEGRLVVPARGDGGHFHLVTAVEKGVGEVAHVTLLSSA